MINMTLLIKDKHSISGRAYHEMAIVYLKHCTNITEMKDKRTEFPLEDNTNPKWNTRSSTVP